MPMIIDQHLNVYVFILFLFQLKKIEFLFLFSYLIGSQKVITTIQGLMLSYEAMEPSLSPL